MLICVRSHPANLVHTSFFQHEQQRSRCVSGLENLSFSLSEKLNMGEIEFVEKKKDWFEVYIMLNDNEGILVYVPKAIFEQHQLQVM